MDGFVWWFGGFAGLATLEFLEADVHDAGACSS